jgi:peptidoglycan/xylan/chitin deacetylase (PgdA/CDA1 family)
MLNALSVDIEDWFHVGAFEKTIRREDWDGLECRVEANTDAVLDLFAAADVKATFFTLGWVASRYPALMRRIVDAGHEVASHGWDHIRVFTMTSEQFADDLLRTRKTLEDATGVTVTGYRAPSFSIDKRTPWAHSVLAEAGYAYSSSVAPVVHDHYGWPEAPRFAFRPVADSFFRLLPYSFSKWAFKQVNAAGEPGIFYFHPWEIDPGQPRVPDAPMRSKIRHYTNLDVMATKLNRMIAAFEWGRVDAVAAQAAKR